MSILNKVKNRKMLLNNSQKKVKKSIQNKKLNLLFLKKKLRNLKDYKKMIVQIIIIKENKEKVEKILSQEELTKIKKKILMQFLFKKFRVYHQQILDILVI